jgi:hypothetical protein
MISEKVKKLKVVLLWEVALIAALIAIAAIVEVLQ